MQKRKPYRNKKILTYAKGQDCQIRLPGCQNNTETTVAAHIHDYEFGHGMGVKSDDYAVAFVDYHCHLILDGANNYDKEWLEGQFHKANTRTIGILFRDGIVK
jgi:hypothetical protein